MGGAAAAFCSIRERKINYNMVKKYLNEEKWHSEEFGICLLHKRKTATLTRGGQQSERSEILCTINNNVQDSQKHQSTTFIDFVATCSAAFIFNITTLSP